jgi:uncharacterized protein (TIRG00374 family)
MKETKNKSRDRFILGIALSFVCIYLIIWKPQISSLFSGDISLTKAFFGHSRLEFSKLLTIIEDVNIWLVLAAFCISPLHVLVRSHRWALMVRPVGRLRLIDSYGLEMIGYFANTALPLKVGEFIRSVLLSRRLNISIGTGLATVLLERILDVISAFVLVMTVAFFYPIPRQLAAGAVVFGVYY